MTVLTTDIHTRARPDVDLTRTSSPVDGVFVLQDLSDLLPALCLVFWVTGQTVEDEGDPAGCGVVALKHEGVNLCSDLFIRQTDVTLILQVERRTEMLLN